MKRYRLYSGIGPIVPGKADVSRTPHYGFMSFLSESFVADTSIADRTYAIVLISALGVSTLMLFAAWYTSRDPIFAKDLIKLPRFRHRDYNSIPRHAENGNGIDHGEVKRNVTPERLTGWRLRLGVLLSLVSLSLVAVHAVILVTSGPTLLRIVFVVYWVYPLIAETLISGRSICVQYLSLSSNSLSPISL